VNVIDPAQTTVERKDRPTSEGVSELRLLWAFAGTLHKHWRRPLRSKVVYLTGDMTVPADQLDERFSSLNSNVFKRIKSPLPMNALQKIISPIFTFV